MMTIFYTKWRRNRTGLRPIPRKLKRRVDPARVLYWAQNIVAAGANDGERVSRICIVGQRCDHWHWHTPNRAAGAGLNG